MEELNYIYDTIWKCYKKQEYYDLIVNFEKYLSLKNAGLSQVLMAFYAQSLERLGFCEDALKAYQIRRSFYNIDDDQMAVIRLLHHVSDCKNGKKEVAKLLSNEPDNPYYHFLYGKFCFLNAELEEAKKHFALTLKGKENKKYVLKAQQYLIRIKKYEEENCFIKISYDIFLKQGNELKTGYVVNVKNNLQYMNKTEKNGDTNSIKRPYLIWKIEDDKVYAFQITGSINERFDYVINPNKYCNINTELTCKDNVFVFNRNNISSIVEKLDFYDYDNLLLYTYEEIMRTSKEEREKRSDFLDEMQNHFQIRKLKLLKKTTSKTL